MRRRSPRELARVFEDVDPDEDDEQLLVAYEDPRTGELYDEEEGGNRIDREECEADLLVVLPRERVCITRRETAERAGYEILGPADVPTNEDCVRVPSSEIEPENHNWSAN